jgi:pentatricopeptide repeat protein
MINRGTFESMIRAMGIAQRLSDAVLVFEQLLRPGRRLGALHTLSA